MLNQPSNNDERRTYAKPVMTAVELAFEEDILGSLPEQSGDAIQFLFDF